MQLTFLSLLALLFIGLKLGGVIAWSWWLVMLPLYGGFIIALFFFAVVALIALFGKPSHFPRRW